VTARALYPNPAAQFSYIGHSNGTYLLAKALQLCPAVRFENVLFAGSVVHTRYDWSSLIPARVARVVNYVATDDKVVAVFPQGLERLRYRDLGGAGHLGFEERWSRFPGQFGGLAKMDSGFDYAANFSGSMSIS